MNNLGYDIIFHARFSISNHFDELVNSLDIHTEIMLMDKRHAGEYNEINQVRNEFINKIREVEQFNLNSLKKSIDNNDHFVKLIFIFKNKEKQEDGDDLFKSCLILNDCYLLKDLKSKIGLALIITDWYNSKAQLEFLKYAAIEN